MAQRPCLRSSPSPKGTCLKIVAVSRHQRFVRILNQSLEETVDLGGFVLQQLVLDFPVCMYRFPPNTLLAPQHHITVSPAPRASRGPALRRPPTSPVAPPPALPRCGARGPVAPRGSSPPPWARSPSTSTPDEAVQPSS